MLYEEDIELVDDDKKAPPQPMKINSLGNNVNPTNQVLQAVAKFTQAMNDKIKKKEIMLTFQNFNKNKIALYVKGGLTEPEEKIKSLLPMATYTLEKGKAFAYQEWIVRIDPDEMLDDEYQGQTLILKFTTRRNMHVKIPGSQATKINSLYINTD